MAADGSLTARVLTVVGVVVALAVVVGIGECVVANAMPASCRAHGILAGAGGLGTAH